MHTGSITWRRGSVWLLTSVLFAALLFVVTERPEVDVAIGQDVRREPDEGMLERRLWANVSDEYKASIESGWESGIPVEYPLTVALGSVFPGLIHEVEGQKRYTLNGAGKLWAEDLDEFNYEGTIASFEDIRDQSVEARKTIASSHADGELSYKSRPLLGWIDSSSDEPDAEKKTSMLGYSWVWWPTRSGRCSLAVLDSQAMGTYKVENVDQQHAFMLASDFEVKVSCEDKDFDVDRLVAIGDLTWWKLGEWTGITRRADSVNVLLLVPGLEFAYEHLLVQIVDVDARSVHLRVHTRQPNSSFYEPLPKKD